jgi:hypothetical protein
MTNADQGASETPILADTDQAHTEPEAPARTRRARPFPASTFEDALPLAVAIQQFAAGERVRRLTLFEKLDKSPDSGPTRQLITNSSKYGLTTGSYKAEWLELTSEGRAATSNEGGDRAKAKARFELAILHVPAFASLYNAFKEKRLPDSAVLRDHLRDQGVYESDAKECVDTFVLNCKFVGLLKALGGAERLVPIENVLDELPSGAPSPVSGVRFIGDEKAEPEPVDWESVCFYVAPIGDEDSEERRHSDLFLGSLVEPAVADLGLHVVRADGIGRPGMITAQIIEHLVKARVVVADLSFHNPNVFYEMALRHALRLPIVQIVRRADGIPFDVDQFRTIEVDTESIYSLVPQLDVIRSAIANQTRRALEGSSDVENPLTVFYPQLFADAPDLNLRGAA